MSFLERCEEVQPHFLAGEWRWAGTPVDVLAPYDESVITRVSSAGPDEAREAVEVAAEALASRPFPPHERAAVLDAAVAELERDSEAFARLIAREAGKPVTTARVEVTRAISTLRFSAVAARTLAGEMVPVDAVPMGEGHIAFTLRVPVGVVGAITPFNFPLNLVVHKLGPAIAAGCPVVLKPAGPTPLTALKLAGLLRRAGLPDGYLSALVGPAAPIGDVLVADDRVRLISFTGSAAVGWDIRARSPRKRVALELGNTSPAVVAADADLDRAAEVLAANAFVYAGQACVAVQRILVEHRVHTDFRDRFLAAVEQLPVGDPLDEATYVGPVINRGERDRICEWIEEARASGAAIALGGGLRDQLIEPTVIEGAPPDAKVWREEVFGPVVTLDACDSVGEGLARANDTSHGLQAAIFTRDLAHAFMAARTLDFGAVLVNEAPTWRADPMPYGGVKESGNTREGPLHAVKEMTESRLVVVNPG
jgi:acyl-CoA reductase-like NAD-dependent aldehyde dehydrogenase